MWDAIARYDRLNDLTSVLEQSRDVCRALGVIRQSYHFSPIFDEPTSLRTVVHADGFSAEWLALYERADFRKHDPVPARTIEHGTLLPWVDAMERWQNSPEEEAYFAAMRAEGLQHGFGLPLFGPRGRTAYASMDFGEPLREIAPETLAKVRTMAQMGHQRLCKLIDEDRTAVELSDREGAVLEWMARGKSIADIATILDISPETVKTYRARIHQKLGVHDRIGAVVRALKLGIVHI
ncbi:autoinducer binding domain-containing protein [Parerythrobacter aurantius]|uniref:helix-turn-helix transcriptional regulator n=1 Tax=Parerythrobacter aurantius TaxID=3127706 RepID=UPI00324B88B7